MSKQQKSANKRAVFRELIRNMGDSNKFFINNAVEIVCEHKYIPQKHI